MIVGVPKEIKADEYRVGMIPVGIEELVRRGDHTVDRSSVGNVDERVPSFEEQITGVQHIGPTEMKSQVGV